MEPITPCPPSSEHSSSRRHDDGGQRAREDDSGNRSRNRSCYSLVCFSCGSAKKGVLFYVYKTSRRRYSYTARLLDSVSVESGEVVNSYTSADRDRTVVCVTTLIYLWIDSISEFSSIVVAGGFWY